MPVAAINREFQCCAVCVGIRVNRSDGIVIRFFCQMLKGQIASKRRGDSCLRSSNIRIVASSTDGIFPCGNRTFGIAINGAYPGVRILILQ